MTRSARKPRRTGARDNAESISAEIDPCVHMNLVRFLAVEGSHVRCWSMNSHGVEPTFEIMLACTVDGWSMELAKHPPGTEQEIEVP